MRTLLLILLVALIPMSVHATDMRMFKTASAPIVNVGEQFSYTLTADNFSTFGGGPVIAPNTVVTDVLPAGLQFVSATAGQGSCSAQGQTVTCNLGTVLTNTAPSIQLVVVPLVPGQIVNTASVVTGVFDPNPNNNSASATVTVVQPAANLSLQKSAPSPVLVGDEFDFTLVLTNDGPDESTNTLLEDVLRFAFEPLSVSTSQGTCTTNGQTVRCMLGTLAAGASATVTIRVRAAFATNTENTAAAINDEGSQVETSLPIVVQDNAADVSVTKSTSESFVRSGDEFQYTVTVRNNGPLPANGVTLKDYLALGRIGVGGAQESAVEVVSVNPSDKCSVSTVTENRTQQGLLTCDLQTLQPGEEVVVTYTVHLIERTNLFNIAEVTSTGPADSDLDNNIFSHTVNVQGAPGSRPNNPGGGESTDPISTLTGELFFTEPPDLKLGGPMPLKFSRYYASQLGQDRRAAGSMGTNWLHSFEWRLIEQTPDDIEVVNHEGQVFAFERNGNAWTLASPLHKRYQLVDSGTGYRFGDPTVHRIYTFDSNGRLTAIEDGKGNVHTLTYGSGRLTTVSDGLGRTLSFQYNGSGQLTSVTDGQRSVSFTYTDGLLASATGVTQATVSYEYDGAHEIPGLLARRVNGRGQTTISQTYDELGRVVSQSDGNGGSYTITYGEDGTTIDGPGGMQSLHSYDERGYLVSAEDGNGASVAIDYTDDGRRTSVGDGRGGHLMYTYDPVSLQIASVVQPDGRAAQLVYAPRDVDGITFYDLTNLIYPDGTRHEFTYDERGNMLSWSQRGEGTWTMTYDDHGQVLSLTLPTGGTYTRTYNADGTIASATTPGGEVTFAYDELRRRISATYPDGTTMQRTYDAADRVASETDAAGRMTTNTYDEDGNLVSSTDAAGTVTLSYDALGHVLSMTDATGATSEATYDGRGNVSTVTDPAGGVTHFTYDARGHLTEMEDPEGNVWRMTWDARAGIASWTDPLSNRYQFDRDASGRIVSVTSPSGHVTNLSYNATGQVTLSERDGAGTTFDWSDDGFLTGVSSPGVPAASYDVNPLGLVTAVEHGAATWTRQYDAHGRMTSFTDPLGNVWSYEYDVHGNASRVDVPGIGTIDISRDGTGAVASIEYPDHRVDFGYDQAGNLVSGNGFSFEYDARREIVASNAIALTRDAAGRITSVTWPTGEAVTYQYDARGLVTRVQDWVGGETTFDYDAAGRLVGINRPNGVRTEMTYNGERQIVRISEESGAGLLAGADLTRDVNGYVTAATRTIPTDPAYPTFGDEAAAYDAASQRTDFTYDAAGRMTSDGNRSFQWDGASHLTALARGTQQVELTHDAFGRVYSRTDDGMVHEFVWNYGFTSPAIATLEIDGTVDRRFVHTPDGNLLYSVAESDSSRHFYHFDERGNTSVVTDDAGVVVAAYTYDPYGRVLTESAGDVSNPFTFLGRFSVIREDETLYHAHRRPYDAAHRSFLTRDPITDQIMPAVLNPYSYAAGNPLVFVDPVGEDPGPVSASQFAENYDGWDAASGAAFVCETVTTGFDTRLPTVDHFFRGKSAPGGLTEFYMRHARTFGQMGTQCDSPSLRQAAVNNARSGSRAATAGKVAKGAGTALFALGGIQEIRSFAKQRDEALTETERNKEAALDTYTCQIDTYLEIARAKGYDSCEIRQQCTIFAEQYEENWNAAVDIGVADLWLEFFRSTGRFLGGALPIPVTDGISNMQSD